MAMKDMDAALQLVARNDRQADFVGKRSTEMVADAESAELIGTVSKTDLILALAHRDSEQTQEK